MNQQQYQPEQQYSHSQFHGEQPFMPNNRNLRQSYDSSSSPFLSSSPWSLNSAELSEYGNSSDNEPLDPSLKDIARTIATQPTPLKISKPIYSSSSSPLNRAVASPVSNSSPVANNLFHLSLASYSAPSSPVQPIPVSTQHYNDQPSTRTSAPYGNIVPLMQPLRKKSSLGSLQPIKRPPPIITSPQPVQQQQSYSPSSPTSLQRSNSGNESYWQKFAQQSPQQQQAFAFRQNYVTQCERAKIQQSQDLLRTLKNHIRSSNQVFSRLSICHAQLDDNHVKIIVNALKSARLVALNEILLNHNAISDTGANLLAKNLYSSHECFANISSLELFGNIMTDGCCKDMSIMLKQNQNLKRLKLGDNKIGPEGAALLAQGLCANTSLTQLHLGGNCIQVEGLKQICELSLANNTSLTSLGLRDNDVGAEGMKYLSKVLMQPTCSLSDIQLKGNRIMAPGAAHLAQALLVNTSLKVLELQSNSIAAPGVQALCSALQHNRSVHALNFNDNGLGCEGAIAVASLLVHNSSITTLGLANNKIRRKGTIALAKALGTAVPRDFVGHSSNGGIVAVTGLDLGNNELGNAGAVALAQSLKSNTILTSLDLRACEIHLKGILAIAEMAEMNTTLRHLDLGSNHAKNSGAHAFKRVLAINSSLTRLCLTDNQIYHDGGEALATGLQTNYTLRNFSYGGQGVAANRIDSQVRRIIDSIVMENKKHWETHQISGDVPLIYQSSNSNRSINIANTMARLRAQQEQLPNNDDALEDQYSALDSPIMPESPYDDLFMDTVAMGAQPTRNSPLFMASVSTHQAQQPVPQQNLSSSPVLSSSPIPFTKRPQLVIPAWFNSTPPQMFDGAKIEHHLEYLFVNKLLKAENPKFLGSFFIGNVINTLRKVFPDTPRNFDEVELVRFVINNPKYSVHLSRELVKTQIKYVGAGNNEQQAIPQLSSSPSSPSSPIIRNPLMMQQQAFTSSPSNSLFQQVHSVPQQPQPQYAIAPPQLHLQSHQAPQQLPQQLQHQGYYLGHNGVRTVSSPFIVPARAIPVSSFNPGNMSPGFYGNSSDFLQPWFDHHDTQEDLAQVFESLQFK